jgi:hypothetical protein
MNLFSIPAPPLTREEPCKGLAYRYLEHAYQHRGVVRQGWELRPLKRRSCPGCRACDGILESLQECPHDVEILADVKHGDVVVLSIKVDSTDWETGHADDWHVLASRRAG